MNDLYLYDTEKPEPAYPSGLQNLQNLFGLDDLALSVARVDENGNKILANKMNKTYKRQIQELDVPGAPDIPKNKYLMDLLMSGLAYQESSEVNYTPFTDDEMAAFSLRPGTLNGYVKYQPPSPSITSRKISKQVTPQPTPQPIVVPRAPIFPGSNSYELVPNRTIEVPAAASEAGDESSDDGSRFKQLERERKQKLRMKRDADAIYGDQKRRRYSKDDYR